MLNVRRLVLLHELRVRGTIAAVALALRYSPSAVSQQISALEREVGVPLLRRSGRGVELTPEAEILADAAARILDILESAESSATATTPRVAGTVRIAVFQSAALALMPLALRSLGDQYEDLRVEMMQAEPAEALHETWARGFDLVIAEEYPGHSAPWLPGLHRQNLTTDSIHLAVTEDSPIRSLRDARTARWVMEPPGTASRHFAEQVCRVAGFEPDVRYETADLQGQIRLIESGNAVALMPDLVWSGRAPSCTLIDLPGSPKRTIFTAQREAGTPFPAIAAVLQTLREAAAQLDSANAATAAR